MYRRILAVSLDPRSVVEQNVNMKLDLRWLNEQKCFGEPYTL